jgi:hypothetical protein
MSTEPANANLPSEVEVEVMATQAGRYVLRGLNHHNARAAQALSPVPDPVIPTPTEATPSRRRRNLITQLAKLAQQPSAWRGGILFLTGCGIAIDPSLAAHISAVGMSLAGLVGMFADDNRAPE